MALINCPECGKEVSDRASVCIHCGYPLSELNGSSSNNEIKQDNDENEKYDLVMVDCGSNRTGMADVFISLYSNMCFDAAYAKAGIRNLTLMKGKSLPEIQTLAKKCVAAGANITLKDSTGKECNIPDEWKQSLSSQEIEEDKCRFSGESTDVDVNIPKCPKCGSTSIQVVKQGFGFGKAAVGALLVGPVGLVGGAIGANKTKRVCLNCNHKW